MTDTNPKLAAVIADLARAKDLVDRMSRAGAIESLIGADCGLPACVGGSSLFNQVFPFAHPRLQIGPSAAGMAPLAKTLGNSWRWRPENVPCHEKAPLIEKLLSDPPSNPADVFLIVPLGLYLAHEGKNRVQFLRKNDIDAYPATITPCDYPAPDRIQLVRCYSPHGDLWWAILDDDLIEPLHYPAWARRVLSAYGVHIHNEWPSSFPKLSRVLDAFRTRDHRTPPPKGYPPISLKALLAADLHQATPVRTDFMSIAWLRLHRSWQTGLATFAAICLCLAGAASFGLFSLEFTLSGLTWFGLGGAFMLLALALGQPFVLPRRLLGDPRLGDPPAEGAGPL